MGWFMQVMLNRLLPSSPVLLLSCPKLGDCSLLVSDILWYTVLVSLPGLKRHPFPPTFPSQHSSKKPTDKDLLPFRWQRRILIPTYILLLWTWKEKLSLVQTDSWISECGILFPFPFFVNFIAKLYSAYLNFFSSPLLRGIQLAKRLEQQLFFFFAQL